MSNGAAKPDWDDGPAVEAWTNTQLDEREAEYKDAFMVVLFERIKFVGEANHPSDPVMQRMILKDAVERKDPDLAKILTYPGMAQTFQSMRDRNRPKGTNIKSKAETKAAIVLARVMVKIVKDIWTKAFGYYQRENGSHYTAGKIVLRRLRAKPFNIKIDPKAIGQLSID